MNVNSLNLKLRAKWTQQLPTLLGHEVHGGKDKTNKTLLTPRRPCVMRVRGPNNAGRAVHMNPALLRYALAYIYTKSQIENEL